MHTVPGDQCGTEQFIDCRPAGMRINRMPHLPAINHYILIVISTGSQRQIIQGDGAYQLCRQFFRLADTDRPACIPTVQTLALISPPISIIYL